MKPFHYLILIDTFCGLALLGFQIRYGWYGHPVAQIICVPFFSSGAYFLANLLSRTAPEPGFARATDADFIASLARFAFELAAFTGLAFRTVVDENYFKRAWNGGITAILLLNFAMVKAMVDFAIRYVLRQQQQQQQQHVKNS